MLKKLRQAITTWLDAGSTPEERAYGEASRELRRAERAAHKAGIYRTDTPEVAAARERQAAAYDALAASRGEETTPETAALVAILRGERTDY